MSSQFECNVQNGAFMQESFSLINNSHICSILSLYSSPPV